MPETPKNISILEIAFKHFLDIGYEGTNIRSICNQAGVEAPTLYYYFKSKKGLFFSVVNKLWEDLKSELGPMILRIQSLPPEEKLFEIYKFELAYVLKKSDEIKFFIRYALFPPTDIKEELQAFYGPILHDRLLLMESIMDDCYRRGIFVARDPKYALSVYEKFTMSNVFEAIFFNSTADDDQLNQQWNKFFEVFKTICR